MNTLTYLLKHHSKRVVRHLHHHKHTYVGGLFAGFALVKAFFLLSGLIGSIVFFQNYTQAAFDDPVAICSGVTEIPETECQALLKLYNDTNGNDWIDNTNRGNTGAICNSWTGITCANGFVTEIILDNNNLVGSLSMNLDIIPEGGSNITSIAEIEHVEKISLENNQIYSFFRQLSTANLFPALVSLNLSGNLLGDTQSASQLLTLHNTPKSLFGVYAANLSISRTQSLGIIPYITTLQELNISNNKLTSLESLTGLTNLTSLTAAHNQLNSYYTVVGGGGGRLGGGIRIGGDDASGLSNEPLVSLPGNIEVLTSLQYLDLSNNRLTELSGSITNLTNLVQIDLSNNCIEPGMLEQSTIDFIDTIQLGGSEGRKTQQNACIVEIPTLEVQTSQLVQAFTDKGYNENTGNNLIQISQGTFVAGVNPVSFEQNNLIRIKIIMKNRMKVANETRKMEIKIPEDTTLVKTGALCPDILISPDFTDRTLAQEHIAGANILTTVKVGLGCTDASLLFQDEEGQAKEALIKIEDTSNLPTAGVVTIRSSEDGINRAVHGTADIQEHTVEFPTTHLTYFTLSNTFDCSTATDVSPEECNSLITLYDATDGDNRTTGTNRGLDTTIDNWYGVTVADGHITELNLGSNNLSGTIPAGALSGLAYVEQLYLHTNNITDIENGSFAGMSAMHSLHLEQNKISSIENGDFVDTPALTFIHLGRNSISTVQSDDFVDVPTLQRLMLNNNQISGTLDTNFAGLAGLIELTLSNNTITDIPSNIFSSLPNLQILGLDGNEITSIEDGDFAGLTSLNRLYLGNNNLTSIDGIAFNGISTLTELSLDGNQLTGVTSDLFSYVPNLSLINLSGNALANIASDSFTNTPLVSNLYLDGNKLCIGSMDAGLFAWINSIAGTDRQNTQDIGACNIDPIAQQYFGQNSIYTSGRAENNCNAQLMTVQYIDNYDVSGLDAIPETLTDNTIYVLLSGSHIISRKINLANCSAIIGSGEVTIYSTQYLNNHMIYASTKQNNIIDNIKVDGENDGAGSTHQKNEYGVYLVNASNNNTINNVQAYNNVYGIFLISSSNNTISNTQTYNNGGYGVYLESSSDNIINNVQAYNNNGYGIFINSSSSNNTLNNIQAYNNNGYGIAINSSSSNNTLNNIQAYNNSNYGILLQNSSNNNTINDILAYNNSYGISLDSSSDNIINNAQAYNNSNHGILLQNSSNNNTINNIQAYNNYYGIVLNSYSDNNTINNSQAYNNNYGIFLQNSSNNNTINNIQAYNNNYGIFLRNSSNNNTINNTNIYNNTNDGIYINSSYTIFNNLSIYSNGSYAINNQSSDTVYYGSLRLFDNLNGNIGGNSLNIGNDQEYPEFFSGGVIHEHEDTMSCDRVTNPINQSGISLIDAIIYPNCNFIGQNGARVGDANIGYLYGTLLPTQTIPLQDTGSGNPPYFSLSNLSWDPDKYIAEINPAIISTLSLHPQGATIDRAIQVTMNTAELASYELYGDFDESPLSGEIDGTGQVNITLTEGFGSKNISVRYSTETKERIITKSISYMENGPVYQYYGIPTYTSGWITNNCDVSNITVQYIENYDINGLDTIPETLSDNTVYVLQSGSHITSRTINIANCSAIVGSGEVKLYSDQYLGNGMLYTESKQNNIIDNIKIDGEYDGLGSTHQKNEYGIVLQNGSNNNTLNNIQAYNNNGYGIFINSSSSNNTLNNIQAYNNNGYGIFIENSSSNNTLNNIQAYNNNGYYGILINSSSNNNTLNNIQAYNNNGYGIFIYYSSNNILNNIQSYNNGYGISINSSSNNIINNTNIYNNTNDGIYTDSSYTIFNNLSIYSNGSYAINNQSSDTVYYGSLRMFDNMNGNIGGNSLNIGNDRDYPNFFSGGILHENEDTMSCDRVTNPINQNGISLIDAINYPNCNLIGQNGARVADAHIAYLYGVQLPKQATPVVDTGTNYPSYFSLSNLSWDPDKYIAEINPVIISTLSLHPQGATIDRAIQITMTTAEPASYELYGDFDESPLSGEIDWTGQVNITLTGEYGNKNISVRYFTGDKERTITKTITYMEDGPVYQYYGTTTYTSGWINNICDPVNMTVQYVDNYDIAGLNAIPETLNDNTIYVLLSGAHITSRKINTANCSAIVGSGKVTLYSNQYLDSMIYTNEKQNVIIDTISIDGEYDGLGSVHQKNEFGIYLNNSSNNTINTSQSYNNNHGIFIQNSSNTIISNLQVYNNQYGILLFSASDNIIYNTQSYDNYAGIFINNASHNTTINNSQSYNNDSYGIFVQSSSNDTTISNSQVYNNTQHGIYIQNASNNTTINNSQSYSNNGYGIFINDSSNNTTINNSQSYNNNSYGIFIQSSSNTTINNSQSYNNVYGVHINSSANTTIHNSAIYNNTNDGIYTNSYYGIFNNVYVYNNGSFGITNGGSNSYYGTLRMFENLNGNIQGESLTVGNDSDYPEFFSGGILYENEDIMSCALVTNPINSSGQELIDSTNYPLCNFIGINENWKTYEAIGYIYGDTLPYQTPALMNLGWYGYSNFSLSALPYNENKHIAEINTSIIGSLTIEPNTITTNMSIVVSITSAEQAYYELFGDFEESPILGEVDGAEELSITLTDSMGIKNISLRLFTGNKERTINTTIVYMDINSPLYPYYNPESSYIRHRDTNPCNISQMQIQTIADDTAWNDMLNTNGYTVSANTMYILESGNYITNQEIQLNTCSSIIGSGQVNMFASQQLTSLLKIDTKEGIIIDRINIDGENDGLGSTHTKCTYTIYDYLGSNNTFSHLNISNVANGIYIENGDYNYLFDITTHHQDNYGIHIQDSDQNTIEDIITYNNTHGIKIDNGSIQNTISNIMSYNNNNYGIHLGSSSYNTINNASIFNNGDVGIYQNNGEKNIYHNMHVFNNNSNGIELNGYTNILHNIDVYNNAGQGIAGRGRANNIYYGNIKTFNNNNNNVDFQQGFGADEAVINLDRTDGTISETGSMNCSRAINPLNADMTYLQNGSTTCNQKGIVGRNPTAPIYYNIGSNISKQNTIVQRDSQNTVLEYGTLDISRLLAVGQMWGDIQSNKNITVDTGVLLSLTTSENLQYTLSGDFVESPIQGTLDGTGTQAIELTPGTGTKNIFLIVSDGINNKNYVTSINVVDPIIMKYYGEDSVYTTHWSQNNCDASQMNIMYIADENERSTILNNYGYWLTPNTIYIFNEGTYYISQQLNINNCNAIIGSGNVTIQGVGSFTNMFNNISTNNVIFENLNINTFTENGIRFINSYNNTISGINIQGTYTNNIYLNDTSYTHIQNITIKGNGYGDGIFMETNADHNIIDNVQTFNSRYGIYLTYSNDTIINNVQSYNNTEGIYLSYAYRNSINNTQCYKNTNAGIKIDWSDNNIINNTLIYNNTEGIVSTSNDENYLNNMTIYNNGYGITNNAGTIKYYGPLKLFANDSNSLNNVIAGMATGVVNRGILDTTLQTISCERVTNPINANGISLRDGDTTCISRGQNEGRIIPGAIQYRYGNNIGLQIQPITSMTGYSTLERDVNKYIAETNNISLRASIRFQPDRGYTISTGIQVALYVDGEADYEMSGDFIESPMIGTLSGSELQNITLTEGFGVKNISIRYVSGDKDTIKTKSITYMEDGLPYQYYGSPAYTSGWITNTCDLVNMNVQYVNNYDTDGIDTIPEFLNENTVYVLLSGSHITSRSIYFGNCSAIVGSGEVTVYGSQNISLIAQNKQNIVVDNIQIDGTNDGLGSTHNQNDAGIYLETTNNSTIAHVETYNNGYGIHIQNNSNNNLLRDILSHNNEYGIGISSSSNENTIENSKAYNNIGQGIQISVSSTTIRNIQTYNNGGGLSIDSSNNSVVENIQAYNNTENGITFYNANNNTINNAQLYNNTNGIGFYSTSKNNIINNIQTYNNTEQGILLQNNSNYNTINNTQVYNNNNHGVMITDGAGHITINNSIIYSNANDGISINTDYHILNNVAVYNNGQYGITNNGGMSTYFGLLEVFANNGGNLNGGREEGNISAYPGIFTGGIYSENAVMSCNRYTNPQNSNGEFLVDEFTYPNCNFIGQNTSWGATDTISYLYGISIPLQTQPIEDITTENNSYYVTSTVGRNTNNYIAEITPLLNGSLFSIPDTTYTITGNIQLALRTKLNADYELSGDFIESPITGTLLSGETKNVTLTEGFGSKTFSIRYFTGTQEIVVHKTIHYIDANGLPYIYYGSGSEYTNNRNENICDIGSMNVEYIDNYSTTGIDAIPEYLNDNTIYVLQSGSHITSRTINTANCSAIVASGQVTVYSNQYLSNGMIYFANTQNTIIDHITIDGRYNGIGSPHQRNEYGISINNSSNSTIIDTQIYNNNQFGIYGESINHSTINNFRSHHNTTAGIYLSSSTNNSIRHTTTHHDGNYGIFLNNSSSDNTINNLETYNNNIGIYIQYSSDNTINNSQTHNNSEAGVLVQYNSNNNTIDSIQSYNNGNAGIFLQYYSNNTIMSNIQSYNNGQHGIHLDQGVLNTTINNTQAYNNGQYGIYINSSNNTTLNNSTVYNNISDGIYTNSSYGKFNNISIYSNGGYGITSRGSDNTYYGTLRMFENSYGNFNGEIVTTGSTYDYPQIFSGGVVYENQENMSCAWVTNPITSDGTYLIDTEGYPNCNFIGPKYSRTTYGEMQYIYGTSLPKQTVVVADTGNNNPSYLYHSDIFFDPTKYIAEINMSINGSLSLIPDQLYTLERNIQVQLTTEDPVDYTLYGDFEESPMTGTLIDTETKNITLTDGIGNKTISVIYTTGDKQRTIDKIMGYITDMSEICQIVRDVPVTECETLKNLYNSTDGSNWYSQMDWLTTPMVANWGGVTVSNGHVTTLSVEGNNLSGSLSNLSGLPYLSYISFRTNQITNIEDNAFSGLLDLSFIDLTYNKLASISTGTFAGIPLINQILLYENNITSIEDGAFSGLTNLQYLYLHHNLLTSVSSQTFARASSLHNLDLSNNTITTIEDGAFSGLASLSSLKLNYNNISIISSGTFGRVPNLYYLELYNNQIQHLPKNSFAGLSRLNRLYIVSNGLSTIEDGVFSGLNNIQIIDLGYNSLSSLPTNVFSGLTNLQRIYLRYNTLTQIPNLSFRGAPNLQYIIMNNNNIQTIGAAAFSGISNVRALYLNNNSLYTLPNTITQLTGLQNGQLILSNNKICTGMLGSGVLTFLNTKGGGSARQSSQNTGYCFVPTASINYIPGTLTNQDVIAYISFNKTGVTINNNGGLSGYQFTGNTSFDFTFVDLAGYTGSATATVTWIDKIVPTADIIYSITGLTNQDVMATISGSEILTGVSSTQHIFTGNGSFTFEFEDLAGNTGSATATVTWIDKITPIGTIIYTPGSGTITTGNVVATLTLNKSGSITSIGGNTHLFTGNGSFTFEFVDLAGNTWSATATVTWIDTTTPTTPQTKHNGGGARLPKDECPPVKCGDVSPSYYDKTCGICIADVPLLTGKTESTGHASAAIGSIVGSPYSDELNNAYLRAFGLGITTMPTIQKANITNSISRIHLAKMVVEFANKTLKTPLNTGSSCNFTDISNETSEMKYYAKLACYLGIMGKKSDGSSDTVFNPRGTVTRAQFATILSRLLYGNSNNITIGENMVRYEKHLKALHTIGIIKDISKPSNEEIRGYVMLMLMRTANLTQ